MIELNGFALLGKKESELITGNDIEKYFWLPLRSLNYEEIVKLQQLVRKNGSLGDKCYQALKNKTRIDGLLELQQKALLASMLADVCTNEKWEKNLVFLSPDQNRNAPLQGVQSEDNLQEKLFLDKEKLDWIKGFSKELKASFNADQRKQLGALFQSLSELYYAKYEKKLDSFNILSFFSSRPGFLNKDNPWTTKAFYRVKTDSRGRIIANWKGEILLEYIQPAKPIPVSDFFFKIISPKRKKEQFSFATQNFFRGLDQFCGEIAAGMQNFFENYFTAVSHKEIRDPYAKAFALFYWSLKDFLESRTGHYTSKGLIFDYRLKKVMQELFLKEKIAAIEAEIKNIETIEKEKIEELSRKVPSIKEFRWASFSPSKKLSFQALNKDKQHGYAK
ncbi:hypothetical protein EM20IM_00280 [Candidatus Methylacidiphilum infernorum]|uniref:Uncharacterized protein n=1 Tax=Candidatus Methylacidiphilum infernorum TaxID=511746 RepID=A0ABX7PVB9_9BACT|nr:hypothetical protein [Candidatus Methylacidiphilum infernorum]QSR86847.1 hypothetical protein EM20IM_00280 [Candidatus Methylacidiphilum infernorum]